MLEQCHAWDYNGSSTRQEPAPVAAWLLTPSIALHLPLHVQPVVGDWQQRVKQAKRQQRSSDAAAAATAAAAAAEPAAQAKAVAGSGPAAAAARGGKPDLDALSEGLPSGWRAMWDATHSRVYYGNLDTQASMLGFWCSPLRCAPPAVPHAAPHR